MKKIGLILEGGGMRGRQTAGVLDFFIEKYLTLYSGKKQNPNFPFEKAITFKDTFATQ